MGWCSDVLSGRDCAVESVWSIHFRTGQFFIVFASLQEPPCNLSVQTSGSRRFNGFHEHVVASCDERPCTSFRDRHLRCAPTFERGEDHGIAMYCTLEQVQES